MNFCKKEAVLRNVEITNPASKDKTASLELGFRDLDWHSEDKASQSEVSGTHLRSILVVLFSSPCSECFTIKIRKTKTIQMPYYKDS